ncbi:chromate efflux transporter [Allosediminivita pacifica]|uniref:Chromate transporter n=1 Tax=Allosediminivita pacifica TaxID=1267769 RepID=A0A2T6AYI8_9RHOB|nr:chromate efflux transporter [Allosediminivita pacifica]PTX48874.1 chromate transporter [Allosediminivita pacifica]GGB09027.1 chromate transporter [Allosediminivita pacifica]
MTTPLASLARVFGRIGVLSFGGPAAQIALMHRALVEETRWLSERQFLSALSFCMLLPGPEAMQLATYAGWRLRGIPGGLVAGTLFVLPGALVIAALALLYARFGAQPETGALLLGVKAAVIVIVVQALLRLGQKALKTADAYLLAALSFLAIFALGLPFPLIIAVAGLWGFLRSRETATDIPPPPANHTAPATLALWAALWLLPLPVLWLAGQTLLFDLAAFFARLAVVTFGGAYAVLAYMAQEVVQNRGWLDATQMVDALGLAETTPGPLILVTQFVGMLTGHAQGGAGLAILAGLLTLWMTFVPCFLWIFAGAPYVESLLARPRLQSALSAITAAVVGVILNLSLWFAFHVVFTEVAEVPLGPLTLDLPRLDAPRWDAWPLIALAAIMLGPLRRGIPLTLLVCALAGWGISHL